MLHPATSTSRARPRGLIAGALAFVLVSVLVLAAGPAAPIGEAAKGASITITADHQIVKAGDRVTLKIKLQNVDSATLNGEALPAGKDSVQKKVLVCTTTTYTVAAMPKDGGPKISQALTITASGTTTKAACASSAPAPAAVPAVVTNPLPDLVVVSLAMSQSFDPKTPYVENVRADYTIKNQGQAPAVKVEVLPYFDGVPEKGDQFDLVNPGEEKSGHFSYDPYKDGDRVMVAIVIDSGNSILESDETNNTAVANITVVLGTNTPEFSKILKSDQLQLNKDPNLFKLIKP